MELNVRTEIVGPIDLIGVVLHGNPIKIQFHTAWERFGQLIDEIKIPLIGKNLYGLQIYSLGFPTIFEITYLAAIELDKNKRVPIRMVRKVLPKCTYVVQRVIGGVNGIDESINYLYKKYIPENGLKVAYAFDFEKYLNIENRESISKDIEIWVPIKSQKGKR